MVHIKKGEIEKNKVEVEVTVEQEQVEQAFKGIYRELSQKVKIPGFRSGRVPENILEMNLGKEYLNHQVAERLIKDSYTKAIEDSKLDPIDVPKIDLVQIEKGKPFIYKMVLEVKPDFAIPALDDITIEKKKPEITELEVEKELEKIRENYSKLKPVEDRESRIGEFLIVDYEAFLDDKPLKNSKREKQLIQLGERAPHEFNKNLVGLKPGDEKEVTIKFPENHPDKQIAGKEIIYQVKLSEIKVKELPEIDDNLAKSVGDYQTLEELKEHIRKQLTEQAKYEAEREFYESLMEKVAEKCNFEVPEVLIEKQLENMIKDLEEDLKERNISLTDYYQMIKADEDKVKKEFRVIAEKQIKRELIIDKIIQDDKITATEEDVNKKIEEIAESTNQKPLKVRAMFEKNDSLDNLKEQIKREKAMAILSQKVKIIEK